MSQENVELAARFYEVATGKAQLLAAMPRTMELCDPDIEWTAREDGRPTGVARGQGSP